MSGAQSGGGRLKRAGLALRRRFAALRAGLTRQRAARLGALLLLGATATIWGLARLVGRAEQGRVFAVAEAPPRQVALVFGAGVFPDGALSAPLADRVSVAVELYQKGKVRKLLMSGDNSRRTYDESTAMKQYAVSLGVPAEDVVLDYAGFHTYDSCYRAQAVFDIRSAVLVTQRFHLARALFTCTGLGVDAVGVAADQQRYQRALWYRVREELARARAYLQVRLTHPKPRFLGPKIQVF